MSSLPVHFGDPEHNDRRTPPLTAPPPSLSTSSEGSAIRTKAGPVQLIAAPPAGWLPTTAIGRKKLPWLDDNDRSRSNQVAKPLTKQDVVRDLLKDANGSAEKALPRSDQRFQEHVPSPPAKQFSIKSVHEDPALRATGSSPIHPHHASIGQTKTLSLTSELRPGMKLPTSKYHARKMPGVIDGAQRNGHRNVEEYTPSEHSATASCEKSELPQTLPKKGSASYERLVKRATATKHSKEPFPVAMDWLERQLDLPLDVPPEQSSSAVKDSSELKMTGKPGRARAPSAQQQQRIMSIRPGPTVPAPPKRKATLYPVPTHMMASSGSSSTTPSRTISMSPQPTEPASRGLLSPAPGVSPPRRQSTIAMPASPPPIPARSVKRQTKHINGAVTGLEKLMADAIMTVRDAAQSDQQHEVARIVNSASQVLRTANTVNETMKQPRALVESRESLDSDVSVIVASEDLSPFESREGSTETVPTLYTQQSVPRLQPVLTERYEKNGRTPASEQVLVQRIDPQQVSDDRSIGHTPPRLYEAPSADSIVRDFAYTGPEGGKVLSVQSMVAARNVGAAADYYGDTGQSIVAQPGVRLSIARYADVGKPLPTLPTAARQADNETVGRKKHASKSHGNVVKRGHLRQLEPVPTDAVPIRRRDSSSFDRPHDNHNEPRNRKLGPKHPHVSEFFEPSYHHLSSKKEREVGVPQRKISTVTDTRYEHDPTHETAERIVKHVRLVPPKRTSSRRET